MRGILVATAGAAAAFITSPVMASPIVGACVSAPVSTYTASGFECYVDGGAIIFSNFVVAPSTSGSGTVGLGNIGPTANAQTTGQPLGEYGLELNYTSNTGGTGGTADVAWNFDVTTTGASLGDAYANLNGNASGNVAQSTALLTEDLYSSTGALVGYIYLSLPNTPSETITYSPQGSLSVTKDQQDYAATGYSSNSSIIQDEFSFATTPIPATLPLLATGLVGLFVLRRKRKQGRGRLESALA